jgi:predicted AAA+ superfamily ATPase
MELIERPAYLGWLNAWRGRDLIKVVTGVRRCGKSTLLELFRRQLIAEGIPPQRIISVNLEDPDVERSLLLGSLSLYDSVKVKLTPGEMNYVFIDEAQHLEQFERTATGLNLLENVDLYVTGSNSRFLSGDLATRLTGRFVEIAMLPLSFAEYVTAPQVRTRLAADPVAGLVRADPLAAYLRDGGFPYVVQLGEDQAMAREYLTGLLNTILLRDVAPRQGSISPATLAGVVDFMFDNVGNPASINRISDTMTSRGRKVGRGAVENYVAGLVDAYLLYPARRYDIKGKQYLGGFEKYYIVDSGLRRALLGARTSDTGHLLENIVFLELLRRRYRVFVGKVGRLEVDFVAEDAEGPMYIQVSASIADPATLERELAPLRAIPDHYPRLLLTDDFAAPTSYDGIRRASLRDWLLNSA